MSKNWGNYTEQNNIDFLASLKNKGKLRKGYKYTGGKLKSGLSEIKKI